MRRFKNSRVIFTYSATTLMMGLTRENIDLMGRLDRNLLRKKTSASRPLNRDITCFWLRNQAIQKSRIIFTYRTTTLMKGSTDRKLIWWAESAAICFLKKQAKLDFQTGISRASGSEMRRFKNPGSSLHTGPQLHEVFDRHKIDLRGRIGRDLRRKKKKHN